MIFKKAKDGGPQSPVDAYFLCEFKGLFSIALLKFNKGRRESFHSHAFNAWTWFLYGSLIEESIDGQFHWYTRSLLPKVTRRKKMHRVEANKDSWCFTVRGPWTKDWQEIDKERNVKTTLTHGRIVTKEEEYVD